MDCIEGSKRNIPDNSVDLIISDPPYGIKGDKLDKHYNRDESFVVSGYVEVPESEYAQFSIDWIREAERILRPGGSIYIVSGYSNLHHVLNALHHTKLKETNHLIWKYNFGVFTKNKYISSHYHILFWRKPRGDVTFNTYCRYGDSEREERSSLNYMDREDVFIINREYKPGEIKNKNELPSELLIKMIQYSSNPRDVVCDMFLGGFSTAIVSKGLNRIPIGFEISPEAYKLGLSRVQAVEEGYLLDKIKQPNENQNTNCGKPWSEEDREKLKELVINCNLKYKKDIIAYLSKETGRGRWSIERELKKLGSGQETQIKNVTEQIDAPKRKRGRPKKEIQKENDPTNRNLEDFF